MLPEVVVERLGEWLSSGSMVEASVANKAWREVIVEVPLRERSRMEVSGKESIKTNKGWKEDERMAEKQFLLREAVDNTYARDGDLVIPFERFRRVTDENRGALEAFKKSGMCQFRFDDSALRHMEISTHVMG